MNKQKDGEIERQTNLMADLPLTDERAEQPKAGRGDEKCVYVLIGTMP